jgi:hypothetical protein
MKYLLSVLVLAFAVCMTHAQSNNSQADVPAYHPAPPAKGTKLPPVMTQAQLTQAGLTQPAQRASYKAAARIPAILYQLPCYCHCDRHAGHTSLHSCFEGTHGANCGTCMAEALYAYQASRKGWSVSRIRNGIIRGEFQQVDLQHPAPIK